MFIGASILYRINDIFFFRATVCSVQIYQHCLHVHVIVSLCALFSGFCVGGVKTQKFQGVQNSPLSCNQVVKNRYLVTCVVLSCYSLGLAKQNHI